MQTSIEWLIESIKSLDKSLLNKIISIDEYDINLKWVIQQAKEMHKQEMEKTWFDSTLQFDNSAEMSDKKLFEDYYQETFKKD
jgi:hypothetical protein